MANLLRTRNSLYLDVKGELDWLETTNDSVDNGDSYDYICRRFEEAVESNDGSLSEVDIALIEERLEDTELLWTTALFEILEILEDRGGK